METDFGDIPTLVDIFAEVLDGLYRAAEFDADVGVKDFQEWRAVGNSPSLLNLMLLAQPSVRGHISQAYGACIKGIHRLPFSVSMMCLLGYPYKHGIQPFRLPL